LCLSAREVFLKALNFEIVGLWWLDIDLERHTAVVRGAAGTVVDVDVVHHYAWGSLPASANANPGGDLRTNVGAMIDLLDALQRRGSGKIVFTSSGGTVYGKLHQTPVPESHPIAPINAYGAGKASAEIYLSLYRAMHGIDCRIARVANPYGAGQNLSHGQGAVTTFIHRALNRQPITIWGDGEVIRDYIFIKDVAKFLVMLATAPPNPEFIFNVGSGAGLSLNAIVDALEVMLGRKLEVTRSVARSIDVPVSVLSIERATKVIGWSPTTPFPEGISRTLDDMSRGAYFSM
jgi:UDP-glucose 4-epimerase